MSDNWQDRYRSLAMLRSKLGRLRAELDIVEDALIAEMAGLRASADTPVTPDPDGVLSLSQDRIPAPESIAPARRYVLCNHQMVPGDPDKVEAWCDLWVGHDMWEGLIHFSRGPRTWNGADKPISPDQLKKEMAKGEWGWS